MRPAISTTKNVSSAKALTHGLGSDDRIMFEKGFEE